MVQAGRLGSKVGGHLVQCCTHIPRPGNHDRSCYGELEIVGVIIITVWSYKHLFDVLSTSLLY